MVPDDEVLAKARALAAEIAEASPLAVRFAKMALNATAEMSTDAALTLETLMQAVLFEDEEKYRRMTDFLERRRARKS